MEKKVLLVDDSADLSRKLKDFFESESYIVKLVDSSTLALKHIETEFFDLICVDFQLHQLGGMEFIQKIKDSFFNSATTIFLFAIFDEDLVANVKDISRLHLFSKPINSDVIIEEASKVLKPEKVKKNDSNAASFIDPFVEAVQTVFNERCNVGKMSTSETKVSNSSYEGSFDFSATFSIASAKLLGNFTLSFSQEVASKIIKASGSKLDEKDMLLDLSVEIFRKVRDIFKGKSIVISKTSPVIVCGKSHVIYNKKGGLTLSTVLKTDLGKIFLEFFLSKQG